MADDASAEVTATAPANEEPRSTATSDPPVEATPTEGTDAPVTSSIQEKEEINDGPAPSTNGATPMSSKKEKRKSVGSVPEHKGKKLNRKQSVLNLNLNAEPGQLWLAVMRGYKAWPCIICDEEMLPESLLSKRPVSAMRPDGSYREDFLEGGKNARDRRYPIMFLGTNEFAWHSNTDLRPITLDSIKKTVEEAESKSKQIQPKALWEAYQVAAEGHDLDFFKNMLVEHEQLAIEALQAEEEAAARKAEAEAAKKKRADPEDEDMPDVDTDTKPKKEKKRKAKDEVDVEDKPTKMPKKLKLVSKSESKETPPVESASKPKKSKKKEEKTPVSPKKPAPVLETAEETHEKMQKTILFLRHRLQKGFLSRDKPPEDSEMPMMNTHLSTLENYHDLSADIIKTTKINKVLKAIIKLATIPREHDFGFKARSQRILASWSKQLAEDTGAAAGTPNEASKPEPTSNGVNGASHKDETAESPKPTNSGAEKMEVDAPAKSESAKAESEKEEAGKGDSAEQEAESEQLADEAMADAEAKPAEPVAAGVAVETS